MKPFHILAGPPGAGKTTTLTALQTRAAIVPEPARRVLAQQRASGGTGTGDQDQTLFVQLMLEMATADYDAASGLTVFDRGLPDLLAFCTHYRISSDQVRGAIQSRRYAPKVFWLPSWEVIYTKDDERKLDFSGARLFGDLIYDSYVSSGYEMVEVVPSSPQERAAFIAAQIDA